MLLTDLISPLRAYWSGIIYNNTGIIYNNTAKQLRKLASILMIGLQNDLEGKKVMFYMIVSKENDIDFI